MPQGGGQSNDNTNSKPANMGSRPQAPQQPTQTPVPEFKQEYNQSPQDPEEPQQSPPPSAGDGNQGDNQTTPQPSPSSQQKPSPQKSSSGNQSGAKDNTNQKKPQPSQQDTSQPQQKQQVEYKEVYGSGEPMQFLDDFVKNDQPGKNVGRGLGRKMQRPNLRLSQRDMSITDKTFQAKLLNVLIDNSFDRRVRGQKRGRLDLHSLHKIPAGSENIFALKRARKNRDYNVILLVDQSGSMCDWVSWREAREYLEVHDKEYNYSRHHSDYAHPTLKRNIDVAAEVAGFLANSLESININYSVIGFGSDYRVYKQLHEKFSKAQLEKMQYKLKHDDHGGTAMLEPVREAFDMARKQKGKNLIISMTDGMPSRMDEVRHFIRGNSSARVAEFIDIGINNPPVTDNGFRINSMLELKPLVLKEIRARVRRG